MAIDPRGADLKRLLADDDGGPFVMLNLLRFADGKREQYDEYVTRADEFVKRYGGELIYCGDASTVLVAVICHPRRRVRQTLWRRTDLLRRRIHGAGRRAGSGMGSRRPGALSQPAGVQRDGGRPGISHHLASSHRGAH